MKKFIAVVTLFIAFSINANAQDKYELSSTDKGTKEAAMLTEYLGLNETQNADFARLFIQKHTILEDKMLTTERKQELARVIEAKIRASLDGNQIEKLEANPELFKQLIN